MKSCVDSKSAKKVSCWDFKATSETNEQVFELSQRLSGIAGVFLPVDSGWLWHLSTQQKQQDFNEWMIRKPGWACPVLKSYFYQEQAKYSFVMFILVSLWFFQSIQFKCYYKVWWAGTMALLIEETVTEQNNEMRFSGH